MSHTHHRAHRAFAAALGALLAGCPSMAPPRSQFPTADDAFGRMKAEYACVNGVQGQAKIDNLSKQGRVRGDVYILVQNPDKVRFEVVSPFGPMIFLLTSDGKEFRYLDVKNKQFVYGPPKACNLARMTQVPVPGHALVSLLRGEAPLLTHTPEQASISWDTDLGLYKLFVDSKHGAREEVHLMVHPSDFDKPWQQQRVRVMNVRVAQMGVDLYTAELKNHKPMTTAPPREDEDGIEPPIPPTGGPCDAELPMSLHITVPGSDQDVIFQYKDKDKKDEPHWNPPVIDGAFTQPEPSGVTKGFADCSDSK
jgi:outer membrane lipoprotein-sorting protein